MVRLFNSGMLRKLGEFLISDLGEVFQFAGLFLPSVSKSTEIMPFQFERFQKSGHRFTVVELEGCVASMRSDQLLDQPLLGGLSEGFRAEITRPCRIGYGVLNGMAHRMLGRVGVNRIRAHF